MVNYFDSQRFGSLKHGQGFIVKDLMRGDFEVSSGTSSRARASSTSPTTRGEDVLAGALGRVGAQEPHPGAQRYEAVVRWLRKNPGDYRGALLRTERAGARSRCSRTRAGSGTRA